MEKQRIFMKYHGSCHCQKVKFSSEFELHQPTLCNCSYCHKRNAVVHVVDNIDVYEGKVELTCYKFNKMKGAHYFCKHCGIFIYLTPPEPFFPYAINLCALDECDWNKIALHHFDGKSL
jgi:hypothetical protein